MEETRKLSPKPCKSKEPVKTEWGAQSVVFTYFQGDINSVVDEHFSRALSNARNPQDLSTKHKSEVVVPKHGELGAELLLRSRWNMLCFLTYTYAALFTNSLELCANKTAKSCLQSPEALQAWITGTSTVNPCLLGCFSNSSWVHWKDQVLIFQPRASIAVRCIECIMA